MDIIVRTCKHGSVYSHEYNVQCCGTLMIKCMSCITHYSTNPGDMILCHKCMGAGWYLQTCPHGSLCTQQVTSYCPGARDTIIIS